MARETISILVRPEREEKFWDKVKIGKIKDCWLWEGKRCGENGRYGSFYIHNGIGRTGKKRPYCALAHRAAYELVKGPIPEGLVIDHTCRNTLCVNPSHLDAVTQLENIERANRPSLERPEGPAARKDTCMTEATPGPTGKPERSKPEDAVLSAAEHKAGDIPSGPGEAASYTATYYVVVGG